MTDADPKEVVCAECEVEWADPQERWRALLDVDDEVALFCPACAEYEFGHNSSAGSQP